MLDFVSYEYCTTLMQMKTAILNLQHPKMFEVFASSVFYPKLVFEWDTSHETAFKIIPEAVQNTSRKHPGGVRCKKSMQYTRWMGENVTRDF